MKQSLSLLLYKGLIIAFTGLVASYGPLVLGAEAGKDSVQGYLILIMLFINGVIMPILFGIALLFFFVTALRFFTIGGHESEGRDKAKKLALYGIGSLVFILSLWGIVVMLVDGLGFDRDESICPDYLEGWCDSAPAGGGSIYYYGSESDSYDYYSDEPPREFNLFDFQ